MLPRRFSRTLIVALVLLAALVVGWSGSADAQTNTATGLSAGYEVSDSGFIENLGQWDPKGIYKLRNGGVDVWMTAKGFVYQVHDFSPMSGDLGTDPGEITTDQPQGPDENTRVQGHVVTAEYVG